MELLPGSIIPATIRIHCFIAGGVFVINCHSDDIEPGSTAEIAIKDATGKPSAPAIIAEFRLSGIQRVTASFRDIEITEGSMITLKNEMGHVIAELAWLSKLDDQYLEIRTSGSVCVAEVPDDGYPGQ